jgi:Holliday junction resolvase RusA-like endonuclease
MLSFFMPMRTPTTTFQAKRLSVVNGKPRIFDSPQLKAVKQKLQAHLAEHTPAVKFDGAVELSVMWLFPIVSGYAHGEFKTSKPDTDNLQKALKDAMTRLGFWTDDALVVREIIEKRYGEITGIQIEIKEISEGKNEMD